MKPRRIDLRYQLSQMEVTYVGAVNLLLLCFSFSFNITQRHLKIILPSIGKERSCYLCSTPVAEFWGDRNS